VQTLDFVLTPWKREARTGNLSERLETTTTTTTTTTIIKVRGSFKP
jgi:hypothetical protein